MVSNHPSVFLNCFSSVAKFRRNGRLRNALPLLPLTAPCWSISVKVWQLFNTNAVLVQLSSNTTYIVKLNTF